MRVKPPGAPDDGPRPITEVDGANATEATAPAGAIDRAAAVGGVARTEGTRGADPIADIARRLKAGELSPAEAVELLIDDVVARQAGAVLGDRRALADELKDLLRRQTETDPYLASRVRRLGNRS